MYVPLCLVPCASRTKRNSLVPETKMLVCHLQEIVFAAHFFLAAGMRPGESAIRVDNFVT